jgi:hypothetical protein
MRDILAERTSNELGTNAAGAWFSLTKFAPGPSQSPSPSSEEGTESITRYSGR